MLKSKAKPLPDEFKKPLPIKLTGLKRRKLEGSEVIV